MIEKELNKNKEINNSNKSLDAISLVCECGNSTYTHRHSNWIECTSCNKIKILKD